MPKAKKSLNDLLYEVKRIEEHRKELSEKKIRKIYKQLMKELNTFIGEEYVKHADDSGALSYSSLRDRARQARFLEEVASKVDSITPELKKEIMGLVETTYKNCYEGMGKAVESAANTEELASMMSGSVLRPEVLQQSYNNNITKLTLPNVLEKHRQEIIYTIKQELTIGLLNGDRYEKMARRLTDKLDISYKKATNIVRTESHRNIEGGLTDCAERLAPALDDSGMVMVKIWRTMKDERVRPNVVRKTKKGWKVYKSKNAANHEVMEGKVVKEGDFFEFEDGVKTKTPSHSGVAAHDCNCRCFLERDIMTEEEFAKVNANAKTTIAKVTRTVEKGVENPNRSGIIDVEIDEFVPCLRDNKTGKLVDTEVEKIKDLSVISQCTRKNGWSFDWNDLPTNCEVFAIHVKQSDVIEGLIALRDEPKSNAVYMYLGNAAPHNRITDSNKEKRYNGVGGHLFAIAAEKSVKSGYGGFIYGDAANADLLDLFVSKYGATPLPTRINPYRFAFEGKSVLKLLKEYNYEWR